MADSSSKRHPLDKPMARPDQAPNPAPDELPQNVPGDVQRAPRPGTDVSDEAIERDRRRILEAPLPGEEPDGGESTLSGQPREADAEYPWL